MQILQTFKRFIKLFIQLFCFSFCTYLSELQTQSSKKFSLEKLFWRLILKFLNPPYDGAQRSDKVTAIGLHRYCKWYPLLGFKGFDKELRPSKFTDNLILKQLVWHNFIFDSDTWDIEAFKNNRIFSLHMHFRFTSFAKGIYITSIIGIVSSQNILFIYLLFQII